MLISCGDNHRFVANRDDSKSTEADFFTDHGNFHASRMESEQWQRLRPSPRKSSRQTTGRRAAQQRTIADTEIARRAYDLYLARGREDGHDVEDWLRAERDLSGSTLDH